RPPAVVARLVECGVSRDLARRPAAHVDRVGPQHECSILEPVGPLDPLAAVDRPDESELVAHQRPEPEGFQVVTLAGATFVQRFFARNSRTTSAGAWCSPSTAWLSLRIVAAESVPPRPSSAPRRPGNLSSAACRTTGTAS